MMSETKTVWIAWINTDLNEGRGHQMPLCVCESETTALRLGKKRDVQGSDAHVTKFEAIRCGNRWCAPVEIVHPSQQDLENDARLAEARVLDARRKEALERAKSAGMSDEDIRLLGGGI